MREALNQEVSGESTDRPLTKSVRTRSRATTAISRIQFLLAGG
jgi:hypothetical protein